MLAFFMWSWSALGSAWACWRMDCITGSLCEEEGGKGEGGGRGKVGSVYYWSADLDRADHEEKER